MSSNFYHWHNSNSGPKKGALVFQKGHLEFDLTNRDDFELARSRLSAAIGEVWLTSANNLYSAEGNGIYTRGYKTLIGAVQAWRKAYNTAIKRQKYLETHPVVNLREQLKCHDWYYNYSDDHGVWSAGESHWREIDGLIKKVKVETVRKLWKKYAPSDFKCPV